MNNEYYFLAIITSFNIEFMMFDAVLKNLNTDCAIGPGGFMSSSMCRWI